MAVERRATCSFKSVCSRCRRRIRFAHAASAADAARRCRRTEANRSSRRERRAVAVCAAHAATAALQSRVCAAARLASAACDRALHGGSARVSYVLCLYETCAGAADMRGAMPQSLNASSKRGTARRTTLTDTVVMATGMLNAVQLQL